MLFFSILYNIFHNIFENKKNTTPLLAPPGLTCALQVYIQGEILDVVQS